MNLAQFIIDNMELILQEWEDFARTIYPIAQNTSTKSLRDHAQKILLVIVADLEQMQSKSMQSAKSKGLIEKFDAKDTAADRHGALRMKEGFSMNEMVSEFRALRASVTKLWTSTLKELKAEDIDDLIRFNEAIDQALTESVFSYTSTKEQQTRLFEAMLSSSHDLSYILDLEGKFIYVNKAMLNLYHKPPQEILGRAIYNYAMPTAAEVYAHIQSIINTGEPRRGEVACQDSSGRKYFFEYTFAPVYDHKGKIEAIAGTSQEITERKMAELELLQNANYDTLTGIANRRLLLNRLEQIIKDSSQTKEIFAVVILDLDGFKQVNDQFGHEAGDLILKQTAQRIRTTVRELDTVARLGGDEFTLILNDVHDIEQAKVIAGRLLIELAKPFQIEQIQLSASIGIALSSPQEMDPNIILRNADRAMYFAKKAGGNQLSLYEDII